MPLTTHVNRTQKSHDHTAHNTQQNSKERKKSTSNHDPASPGKPAVLSSDSQTRGMFEHDTSVSGRLFRIWYNLSHVRMWESHSYASLSVTCARGQVIEKLERCLPHGPGLGRRKFEPRTIRLVSWCDVDLIADHVELFVTSNLHAHACSRACSVDCGPCVS